MWFVNTLIIKGAERRLNLPTEKEPNWLVALKAGLSELPALGHILKSYDQRKRIESDRNRIKVLTLLNEKIANPALLFSDEWLRSEEGETFARKVFESAFDAQLSDKQELFINALINGIEDKKTSDSEKLKFVDMLRHLSRPSLDVLAEMHNMYKDRVRGPGREVDPGQAYPIVNPGKIADELNGKGYDPYLVESVVYEMQSQGLFSKTGEYRKRPDGSYHAGGGYDREVCCTDFTLRFVEFITRADFKELTDD